MNLNNLFYKSFRVLLLPISILYGIVIIIRNWLYDKGYLKSAQFNFPLICVGNLAVGGTGKSPMVEYLITLLRPHFKIATLSRGYKRKTKGYVLANNQTTALEIGDEPMQFHLKFPDISVAVGEERIVAIPQLLQDKPDLDAIILDDAFQHRQIRPDFNILLTAYDDLYVNDFYLPTGELRDHPASAKRAKVIIVTKCPVDLNEKKKNQIIKQLKPKPYQKVFFTAISYGTPYHIITKEERPLGKYDEILMVCGIANPKPLKDYLFDNVATYYMQAYSDHHIFTIDDWHEMVAKFRSIQALDKIILTTEKDAVRLIKFHQELLHQPFYVLPIQHQFLFNEQDAFDEMIINFVKHYEFIPGL